MSTQFRSPPRTFFKQESRREVDTDFVSPEVVALHASFKKWRNHRATLRARLLTSTSISSATLGLRAKMHYWAIKTATVRSPNSMRSSMPVSGSSFTGRPPKTQKRLEVGDAGSRETVRPFKPCNHVVENQNEMDHSRIRQGRSRCLPVAH